MAFLFTSTWALAKVAVLALSLASSQRWGSQNLLSLQFDNNPTCIEAAEFFGNPCMPFVVRSTRALAKVIVLVLALASTQRRSQNLLSLQFDKNPKCFEATEIWWKSMNSVFGQKYFGVGESACVSSGAGAVAAVAVAKIIEFTI